MVRKIAEVLGTQSPRRFFVSPRGDYVAYLNLEWEQGGQGASREYHWIYVHDTRTGELAWQIDAGLRGYDTFRGAAWLDESRIYLWRLPVVEEHLAPDQDVSKTIGPHVIDVRTGLATQLEPAGFLAMLDAEERGLEDAGPECRTALDGRTLACHSSSSAYQRDPGCHTVLKARKTFTIDLTDLQPTPMFTTGLACADSWSLSPSTAWNWIAASSFSSDASSVVHTSERQSEKEVRMADHEVRWDRYPAVAQEPMARGWLAWQADRNLARHTVETYGRSLDDFLRFLERGGTPVAQVTREQIAAYVRDLLGRSNPRQPKVVRIDSGAGLANATIQLRLAAVRLFFEHLVEDGVRATNPVGRGHARGRGGWKAAIAPLVRRHRKLPWIPTEEQWQALLAVMRGESIRNRLMFALSYDAALRRQELLTLDTADIDPAHRLVRIRAEHGKNRCERVVPYSEPTARLYTTYLQQRRQISRARGRVFLSVSNRNAGRALTIWSWSKTVISAARRSGVSRFTTHTLRHLCLTDLARGGWDIHEIAAFAGHRSLASTLLYIHLSGRDLSSKLATTMSHLHAWRVQHVAGVQS
jgi:site-specific recombinase XerD